MRNLLFLTTLLLVSLHPFSLAQAEAEKRISPEEAAELFRSVDELLRFASEVTGLEQPSKVERKLSSRDEVEKYILEKMAEDEDQQRLERSEVVLKKFGLLPRDFALRSFMVSLLRDQVAGFYDSKRKTVYLSDWIEAEAQKPVLAHELTHALQDQAIDLERWMKQTRENAKRRSKGDTADADYDEQLAARTALVEGQGMLVLLEYMLQPTGRSVADAPEVVGFLRKTLERGEPESVTAKAPLLIREGLLFPYRDGLGFVHALLQDGGKKRAYADALRRPPQTTREILAPLTYLTSEAVPPIELPDLEKELSKKYERYDVGSVGDFDIRLFAKQFDQAELADTMGAAWRGGLYHASRRKDCNEMTPHCIAVVYFSKWASPADAQKFADFYASTVPRRYSAAKGKQRVWETEEGRVEIEVSGENVIAYESFDSETKVRLHEVLTKRREPARAADSPAVVGSLSLRPLILVYALREMWH
jgi:hypothetical protein